jgi:hypothetical protein
MNALKAKELNREPVYNQIFMKAKKKDETMGLTLADRQKLLKLKHKEYKKKNADGKWEDGEDGEKKEGTGQTEIGKEMKDPFFRIPIAECHALSREDKVAIQEYYATRKDRIKKKQRRRKERGTEKDEVVRKGQYTSGKILGEIRKKAEARLEEAKKEEIEHKMSILDTHLAGLGKEGAGGMVVARSRSRGPQKMRGSAYLTGEVTAQDALNSKKASKKLTLKEEEEQREREEKERRRQFEEERAEERRRAEEEGSNRDREELQKILEMKRLMEVQKKKQYSLEYEEMKVNKLYDPNLRKPQREEDVGELPLAIFQQQRGTAGKRLKASETAKDKIENLI